MAQSPAGQARTYSSPMASPTSFSTTATLSPCGDVSNTTGPSSPGSPVRTVPGRTLRRKRSTANAALTTRPSHLSLRDRSGSTSSSIEVSLGSMSLSSASSVGQTTTMNPPPLVLDQPLLEEGQAHLVEAPPLDVSPSALVLVHTESSNGKEITLAHALFQPNFLIDAHGHVRRLSRTEWERARATVEEARIVGMCGGSVSASSPKREGAGRRTIIFGNEGEEGEESRTFHLQARAAAAEDGEVGGEEEEGGHHGASPGRFLEIVIRGRDIEKAGLPSQLCALLEQSKGFSESEMRGEDNSNLCDEILYIVRGRVPTD